MPDLHFDAARAGKGVVSPDQLTCMNDMKQKPDNSFTALLDPPVDDGGKMLRVMAFNVENIDQGFTTMGLAPENADLSKSLKRQSAFCYTQDAKGEGGGGVPGATYLDGKVCGQTGSWSVRGGVLIVWTKDDAGVCRARLHVGFERIGKGPGSEVPAAYNRFAVSAVCMQGHAGCKFIMFPELAAEAEAELRNGEEGFEAWLKQKRAELPSCLASCCLIA